MADIFVSYARKNTEHVRQIMEELQRLHYRYWMDTHDVRSGEDWPKEITEAILDCRVFLLFMSSASMASDNVKREVQIAYEQKKKIIILRLEEVELSSAMRYQLAGIQWTDCWMPDWPERVAAALGNPTQTKLTAVDELFTKATRLNFQGLAEQALQLFREIKEKDPYYPNIDLEIRSIEEEIKKGFVDRGGYINVNRLKDANTIYPTKVPAKSLASLATKYLVPLITLVLIVVIGIGFVSSQFLASRRVLLWTFDQGPQAWQPEKRSDTKLEASATGVSWNSSEKTLQGDFDFGIVDPRVVFNGKEPRATYFVPVDHEDWSAFRTLTFTVKNLSTHDLKVMFSISDSGCWYEFGRDQTLPKGLETTVRFDLTDPGYKTCQLTESYTNPAPPFKDVWRFDIIFTTPEDPWDGVNGSVLIDDVKLTDRIPDTTK